MMQLAVLELMRVFKALLFDRMGESIKWLKGWHSQAKVHRSINLPFGYPTISLVIFC